MKPLRPIKACHICRRSFTLLQWNALPYLTQETADLRAVENQSGTVEVRRCPCDAVLALDKDLAEQVADAVEEHTSSRAEPPPEALDGEPPPEGCAVDRWAYRTEAITAFALYLHAPVVPYPKPIPVCRQPTDDKNKAEGAIGMLLAARMLIDHIIRQWAARTAPPPTAANQEDDGPPPSNVEGP